MRRTITIRNRRGIVLVYMIALMVILMAFASIGVDYGRVQLTKTELQRAADAAARYAATGVADGTTFSKASAVAAQNSADGTPVVLTSADLVLGNWDATLTPMFSSTRTPQNAIQITARRTAARGDAVRLMFAPALGVHTCDVHATSIAKINLGLISGFIGLNGFDVKNNLFSGGYDSSADTSPTESTALYAGMIGSNTWITTKNNEVIGEVVLGPSATHNLGASAPITRLTTNIPTPAINFTSAPATNPGGVSQTLTVNGTTTLAGGIYYFTSITLNNNSQLKFAGAATLYVNGSVTFANHGTISAYGDIPGNLTIRQRGASSIFGGNGANTVDVTADIEAPQTAFIAKNSATLRGRGIFDSIDAKNNLDLFYDERLNATIPGTTNPTGAVSFVQ